MDITLSLTHTCDWRLCAANEGVMDAKGLSASSG